MNRVHTPYDSEHTPKADCDCCGKYAELSFSLSYGIDTWTCDECRNPPRERMPDRVIDAIGRLMRAHIAIGLGIAHDRCHYELFNELESAEECLRALLMEAAT